MKRRKSIALMIDPLEAGLVSNLAKPGGNLTGITLDAGIEIWGKRLELLKQAVPSISADDEEEELRKNPCPRHVAFVAGRAM
jgi:hypothetical protein